MLYIDIGCRNRDNNKVCAFKLFGGKVCFIFHCLNMENKLNEIRKTDSLFFSITNILSYVKMSASILMMITQNLKIYIYIS